MQFFKLTSFVSLVFATATAAASTEHTSLLATATFCGQVGQACSNGNPCCDDLPCFGPTGSRVSARLSFFNLADAALNDHRFAIHKVQQTRGVEALVNHALTGTVAAMTFPASDLLRVG